MSTLAAALTVAALLGFSLAATVWQIRRAVRHESTRNRLIREAHERAAAARETDGLELLYSLPAYDPAWDAGRERLWNAVRDGQGGLS